MDLVFEHNLARTGSLRMPMAAAVTDDAEFVLTDRQKPRRWPIQGMTRGRDTYRMQQTMETVSLKHWSSRATQAEKLVFGLD
jgi:hypothetical protein